MRTIKVTPDFYDITREQYDAKLAARTINEKALYFVLEPNGHRTLYKGTQIVGAKLDELNETIDKLNAILQDAPEEFDTLVELATVLTQLKADIEAGINWWDLLGEPNLKRYENYSNPETQQSIKERGMLYNLTMNGALTSWDWDTFTQLKHGYWYFEQVPPAEYGDMRPPLEYVYGILLVTHGLYGDSYIAFDNYLQEIYVGKISEGEWSGWKKLIQEKDIKGYMRKNKQNWASTNTYKEGEIVWSDRNYYHAKRDVPANIQLSNTTYWENLNQFAITANHVKTIELEQQYTRFKIGGTIRDDNSYRMMSYVKDVEVVRDNETKKSTLHDSRGQVASKAEVDALKPAANHEYLQVVQNSNGKKYIGDNLECENISMQELTINADMQANNKKIVNLANPVNPKDAVNKQTLDDEITAINNTLGNVEAALAAILGV